ncbi:MAG: Urmylation protein [Piccolia ochrophora]|nr:MAG: Urmylation protein [Piccolia ochrophora]
MTTLANVEEKVQQLRNAVAGTEVELARLRIQLAEAEQACPIDAVQRRVPPTTLSQREQPAPPSSTAADGASRHPLSLEEYKRYGRQMIMPEVGLQGQLRLKAASVLIVGVGGLGCPAAAYLAGSGVGTLGLVDGDVVELSNLHRQISHSTDRLGQTKVDSALKYLQGLNTTVTYVPYREALTAESACSILSEYDLVLDCTDHPTSRYLISDAAVLLGKPLVSASALRAEGQLMVLNNPPAPPGDHGGGPCYRCVFPKPPSPESVMSCGEGGILGPVVGVMGVLQALEAIKVIAMQQPPKPVPPCLLLFSALSQSPFRSIRLRGRRTDCAVCAATGTITQESLKSGSLDYAQFCGVPRPIDVLEPRERISASSYKQIRDRPASDHVLLDVREEAQYQICNLAGSHNLPFSVLRSQSTARSLHDKSSLEEHLLPLVSKSQQSRQPIYVICRLGNDSQLAVRILQEKSHGLENGPQGQTHIMDIKGGFQAWREEVDSGWPDY